MENRTEKKRLGTLDYFIIFALIAVIVCFAVRFISTERSSVAEKVELEDYIVSFKVSGIKDSSAKNYMEPGSRFYISDTELYFGELIEGLTIKDAETYYQLHNGEIVIAQNNATGDLYRVDVEGAFLTSGLVDQNGCYLLGGNTYLGVNKTLTIKSKYLKIIIEITDIRKA